MTPLHRLSAVMAFASGWMAHGQTQVGPDTSGNGMLKGTYYFRQLAIVNWDDNGNVTEVAGLSGMIVFDGNGNYNLTGQMVDNTISGGAPQPLNVQATYGIGSNGTGWADNPINPNDGYNVEYGAVGTGGIFIGSDTEGNYNDIFVAIPEGGTGTGPANASFNGSYWLGLIDFTGANEAALKNALFRLSPNGQGGIGAMTIRGQTANQSVASISQSVSGATYSFASDGTATLNIPAPTGVTAGNALFTGVKTMYLSADGNYFLGFTPGGYDIIVGIRTLSSAASNATYKGLFFLGALEDDIAGGNGVDSYYGSANADGVGTEVFHERYTLWNYSAFDLGFLDQTEMQADGSATDAYGAQYAFGAGGAAFLAIGADGFYSLNVAVHAQSFSGSGVFLNPIGVVNSASYSPITASLSPGELITLVGSGLSPVTLAAQAPFPTTLGGVRVLIDGIEAPIYYVSPTQISAIVPYALDTSNGYYYAQVQVLNNGVKSNPVTLYLNDNEPGIFTNPPGGAGMAAALRQDGSVVSAKNPAKLGEYISIFLTGLGGVSPAVPDGAAGPVNPLSQATVFSNGNLAVYFDDASGNSLQANLSCTYCFAGLAPGLAGLYQLQLQVPTGLTPGDVLIELWTDSAANLFQAYIPVAQ